MKYYNRALWKEQDIPGSSVPAAHVSTTALKSVFPRQLRRGDNMYLSGRW